MKKKIIGMVIAGAALVAVQVQAQNYLVNGSFETLSTPGAKWGNGFATGVPGWTGTTSSDQGVDINPPTGGVKAPGAEDGNNAAYFHLGDGYANQTTSDAIQAGLNYDLRFWTMDIDTYANGWTGAANGAITAIVYAGTPANVIAQNDFDLGPSTDGATPGTWVLNDLSITAAQAAPYVGQNIGVELFNSSDTVNALYPAGSWIYVDNVTLVPEPATATLLGFGVLASVLGLRRRRA